MRVIIYSRVSTEDQVEKYGLPLQLRACREYAKAQGWSIVAEIADEGVSGTLIRRPGLDRVREMVASGEAEFLLMVDVDRLSRELAHLVVLKPEIEKHARCEFVNARFEDSPSGELFFNMKGCFAQYERANMQERVMRGKREAARAGKIVGGRVAYGYSYAEGMLAPCEPQASTVQQIFARYVAGESIRGITRRLRAEGAPTGRGGTWGHSSVGRILSNETYAGVAYFGTHQRDGAILRKRKDLSSRIPIAVTPLIARETWTAAQQRLSENPQVGRPSAAWMLRGLLYCACGRRMYGEAGRICGYRCAGRDRLRHVGAVCRVSVQGKTLDALVWDTVTAPLMNAVALRVVIAKYREQLQAEAAPAHAEALRVRLRIAKAKEARCLSLLTDPELSGVAEIKREFVAAQKARLRIEAEADRARFAQVQAQSADAWLDEQTEALREYIPTLVTVEQRQNFLRGLVRRATWSSEQQEVRVSCFFAPQLTTTSAHSGQFPALCFELVGRAA